MASGNRLRREEAMKRFLLAEGSIDPSRALDRVCELDAPLRYKAALRPFLESAAEREPARLLSLVAELPPSLVREVDMLSSVYRAHAQLGKTAGREAAERSAEIGGYQVRQYALAASLHGWRTEAPEEAMAWLHEHGIPVADRDDILRSMLWYDLEFGGVGLAWEHALAIESPYYRDEMLDLVAGDWPAERWGETLEVLDGVDLPRLRMIMLSSLSDDAWRTMPLEQAQVLSEELKFGPAQTIVGLRAARLEAEEGQ
jgi:hypothetical protein